MQLISDVVLRTYGSNRVFIEPSNRHTEQTQTVRLDLEQKRRHLKKKN